MAMLGMVDVGIAVVAVRGRRRDVAVDEMAGAVRRIKAEHGDVNRAAGRVGDIFDHNDNLSVHRGNGLEGGVVTRRGRKSCITDVVLRLVGGIVRVVVGCYGRYGTAALGPYDVHIVPRPYINGCGEVAVWVCGIENAREGLG